MDAIDTNAWKVLSDLLEMADTEFSRHGCNDYALDNTPENRGLIEAMEKWNSVEEWEEKGLNISPDGTKLYTMDYCLVGYFAHLARELAGID